MTEPALSLRSVAPADWPDLALGFSDLGFEQSLAYGQAAAARIGGELRLLAVERQGLPVAAAALRLKRVPGLGRGIAWCPSGPLLRRQGASAPQAEEIVAILAALRHRICRDEGHLLRLRLSGTALFGTGLDATALAGAAGLAPWAGRPPYRSFVLDLTQGTDRLMQRLNGKWRGHLRFAQKSGLGLDIGFDPGLRARFMALYQEVQIEKSFATDIGPEFHFAIPANDRPQPDYDVQIFIATKDGQDIGGIVVATSGQMATYAFGATISPGRPLRAGYFLTWEAVLRARDAGVLWYDLGGVDFASNPDVSGFKERMGGEVIESHPFEARPAGLSGTTILGLERLRSWLKGRG